MIAPPSARPCRQRDDAPERSMAVPEPKPASPKRRFLRVQVMPAGLIQYASCRCYLNCVMRRAAAQIIPKCPRECWRDDARSREFAVHWVPVSGCCRGIYAEDGSDDKGAHCVEEEAEDRRRGAQLRALQDLPRRICPRAAGEAGARVGAGAAEIEAGDYCEAPVRARCARTNRTTKSPSHTSDATPIGSSQASGSAGSPGSPTVRLAT